MFAEGLEKPPSVPPLYRHNINLHSQRAAALMGRKRFLEAAIEYRQAILVNPSSAATAPLYNNLGIAYRKADEYHLAIASFQRAIRVQPNFELYYGNLVETYQQFGQLNVAIGVYKNLVQRMPDNPEAWFILGHLLEQSGQFQEAQGAFQTFLDLDKDSHLSNAARRHLPPS